VKGPVAEATAVERIPRAGVDYPATLPELQRWFPDDDACAAYLAKLRWPDGFVCPVCGSRDSWRTGAGLWLCASCRRKTSVTAGTVFHRSRLPLTSWFSAMWLVCAQKNGISALGLQRIMGFGSYQTAWTWLHKLRRAMVRPDRDRLDGLVEVDETIVGAREHGVSGRQTFAKAVVIIGVELREDTHRLGRCRLAWLPSVSKETLCGFVAANVTKGATVRTDGWNLYKPLGKAGYTHEAINVSASGDPAHVALPGVHRVAALLKRWLAGTLHSGVSHSHLDYYLDEFTFRFNRRDSRARGMLFYRLVQQAVHTDPCPYKDMTAANLDRYIWG